MNCEQMREELRRRFDAGEDWAAVVDPHLESCGGCRAYRVELAELEGSLFALPLAPVAPDLAARIRNGVEAEALSLVRSRRALVYGLAAALGVAAFAGWLFPWTVDISGWWNSLSASVGGMDWAGLTQQLVLEAHSSWSATATRLGELPGLSAVNVWVALGSALALLVGFNVAEALSLRPGHGGSSRGYGTVK